MDIDTEIEKVILVDENDNAIGEEEKLKAHQEGLLHRAFSVFIYRTKDNAIEFLLQKRHKNKYHSGGLWSNTCCSHPQPNETTIDEAKRRLLEEMGITADLQMAGNFTYSAEFENGLSEYEFDHVYVGEIEDQPIDFNKEEVEDYCWMNVPEILEELTVRKHKYTVWFSKALNVALNYLHQSAE